jgi:hypothetical protein
MLWHKWVVLIAGSTALHYVLFALSNLHITPGYLARFRLRR